MSETPVDRAGIDRSAGTRSLYAYDASSYRVLPAGVAFPGDIAEVQRILAECLGNGVPVTCRGAGTSMAGNAVGAGVVLDFSRHMNRVRAIDPVARTATVEPGVVLDALQAELAPYGLMFAPDPSSHSRATVGGMIGNDACGNHSVRYGRTSGHVVALELLLADGTHLVAERGGLRAADPTDAAAVARAAELAEGLRGIMGEHLGRIRLDLGRVPRQVSGYQLQHLLPENGFDVARALVGSEGTCAVVVGITVSLVPRPEAVQLVVLGYPDIVTGARDVPALLESAPAAVEGIEETIVDALRARRGPASVAGLPEGRAWLFVELEGPNPEALALEGKQLVTRLEGLGGLTAGRIVTDPGERAALWRVREDGAGLVARRPDGRSTWAGWEDSAVDPANLADYLADLRALLIAHGLDGVFYGHLGAGCVHIRIDFDLETEQGVAAMAAFAADAADLVRGHGGSVSGEHGDGRARSALLERLYGPELIAAFAQFKRLFDPGDLLNPGIIVDPAPLDVDLAPFVPLPLPVGSTAFAYPEDPAGFAGAAGRCIGVGRCRADGGAMCPSYQATREERDSTRGRARMLQEMIRQGPVADGWRSTEVRDALDLCLSCRACASDCPAGVDMATYKAEFLHLHHKGRIRPRTHYSLGWLPAAAALARRVPALANAVLRAPGTAWLAGIAPERAMPRFARRGAYRRARALPATGGGRLFVDSFTRAFRPEVLGAAQRVLGSAGGAPQPIDGVCCGLTWISTGQLGVARRVLRRTVARLSWGTDPIVVLEPSCAAALKHDAPRLLCTPEAAAVAARVRTFAEELEHRLDAGWTPPPLPGPAVLQTHCHERAVFGAGQSRLLARLGITGVAEATGCCGLAGNFGVERGHHEVSTAVAELSLAPALRAAARDTAVLADGFSCRTQIDHLGSPTRPRHLAELIADHLEEPR
ncbi:FAD-binding and (Fe-S)-binding domain-containing protein [Pseudonocardia halophobica]|uniref:Lactate dehydrogenase n=1 Tax=Pseudonocardia halophobica TaxID=29401 RepID=A0A9W6NYY3_9PSEU|nr:FAD-binding and (Fe-S)-binding domain-containing protein [Pseudonocardia halophobica]GLL14022.1 lactate dehydrogenase [Pseudonocardia halophobica]